MKDNRYNDWDKKLGAWIVAELTSRGPLTTSDFEHPGHARKGSWWGWSDVKRTLERMFYCGALVSGGRSGFKRVYALPEQVLPGELMASPPSTEQAQKILLTRAAKSLGVASQRDLADYFRIPATKVTHLLDELVEDNTLVRFRVDGWNVGGYGIADLKLDPAKHTGTTVVSPFDPVCWNRDRTSRIFGFDYKIEIYVPEPKRIFGYYSLPVLHNGNFIARIDLKSNRQENTLQVKSTWAEENQVSKFPNSAVGRHLNEIANWQGLNSIAVSGLGNVSLESSTDSL
jgi:uncharacterized protein YcaQ